jgi:hypothetical protein
MSKQCDSGVGRCLIGEVGPSHEVCRSRIDKSGPRSVSAMPVRIAVQWLGDRRVCQTPTLERQHAQPYSHLAPTVLPRQAAQHAVPCAQRVSVTARQVEVVEEQISDSRRAAAPLACATHVTRGVSVCTPIHAAPQRRRRHLPQIQMRLMTFRPAPPVPAVEFGPGGLPAAAGGSGGGVGTGRALSHAVYSVPTAAAMSGGICSSSTWALSESE